MCFGLHANHYRIKEKYKKLKYLGGVFQRELDEIFSVLKI